MTPQSTTDCDRISEDRVQRNKSINVVTALLCLAFAGVILLQVQIATAQDTPAAPLHIVPFIPPVTILSSHLVLTLTTMAARSSPTLIW